MNVPKPILIHVGSERPTAWDDIEKAQAAANPNEVAPHFLEQRRPTFASSDIDWTTHGLAPRWVRDETAACAAAIDPSQFHNKGADEFERFLAGADRRDDWAIVVARMVQEKRTTRSVFGNTTSVALIGHHGSVGGKQLGAGVEVRPSDGLIGADKDLAVRFSNTHRDGPLWSLELGGATLTSVHGTEHYDPGGELRPLVIDELGHPVVAVWISPSTDQRFYILPECTPPGLILDWLANHAIPEFAPGAHRETRPPGAYRDIFPTQAELEASRALAEFEDHTAIERAALADDLKTAHAAADDRRDTLLFGTGPALEEAVAACLRDAGMSIVKVDDLLGATSNADLLATVNGRRILIEVKSGKGPASERHYSDLESHLREWPATGQPSVDGGALILNDQIRTEPSARTTRPYGRPEFIASQEHAILTTRNLLDLWRTRAWESLASAIVDGAALAPTRSRRLRPFRRDR